MEKEIIIEVRREHAVALIADMVKLDRATIQIKDTGSTFAADANLDATIIELIVSSAIGGAVGGIASSLTAQLAKILAIGTQKGISLMRARCGKKTVELEAMTREEVEKCILSLEDDSKLKGKS